MSRDAPPVAVLGAGIMGTSLALMLARRGRRVVLFDKATMPMSAASRWNEGKIHLGYLYGADPSLATARLVLPGGLVFGRLVAELIGEPIASFVTPADDIYLVHRDSVVGPEALAAQFVAVDALVRDHADAGAYLADASKAASVPLSGADLEAIADTGRIVAGFRVPERSVDTRRVADRLTAAVLAEPRIEWRAGTTITAATPEAGGWRLTGAPGLDEPFALVANALWEGRLAVDATAGLTPGFVWSNRYRLSVFARTDRPLDLPSAVIAVGPFGDVKNYGGRDFYLSWYPVGLVAESGALDPPAPPPLDCAARERFLAGARDALATHLPWTAAIFEAAERLEIGGGHVFARGRGSIGDPASSLHRRDRFGVTRLPGYYSIDTGKYSSAPWLAQALAAEICGE
jgi:glycine/D-amino acid oxidase-like deaminating enzyme